MKAMKHVFGVVAVLSLGGCAANTGSSDPVGTESVGTTSQDVTVLDCQKQAAACVQSAKSFLDLGACTTKFGSCSAQAAADLAGQSNLLKQCRDKSTACLEAAVTVSDISACRGVFETCTKDVTSTATGGLKDAIGAAQDAIEKASDIALGVIQDAAGTATGALDALTTCTTQANVCLKSVVTLTDISKCQSGFETCAGKAVALVDQVVAPLPIPTPSEIASTLGPCQDKATQCLAKAITAADISACKGTLQTCVKGVTSLADSTVDDVNKLLPPIIQLPTPTATVDCTTQAADCLLQFGANPLTCAEKATACLTK